MCQQLPRAQKRCRQATENRAYVRRLLSERDPVFLALLQSAVRQVDLELARDGHEHRPGPNSPRPERPANGRPSQVTKTLRRRLTKWDATLKG
jgi:hypothetical protein